MNGSVRNIPSPEEALESAYLAERTRILSLSQAENACDGDFSHPVFGEGDAHARVMLVGEAPGGEEAASGRPFVGKAGKQLAALLAAVDIARDTVYITNAVKYRPVTRSARSVRNRTPSKAEVLASLPLLKREIETVRPAVIVTLGNTPLSAVRLLSESGGEKPAVIGALHGAAHPLHIAGRSVALFPLYHPASGIYNRALVAVMEADMQALSDYLSK